MTKPLLYLEDDETLALMTNKALTRNGYKVDHYASIQAVREGANTKRYTHALLDMKLEDGNSIDLVEELTQANPALKIVLLTGYASIATAVKAVKQGAHNYLPKPATIEEVLAAFGEDNAPAEVDQTMSLKRLEWEKIQSALIENDGNISLTAKQLNMHRRTLQRKLQKKPVAN